MTRLVGCRHHTVVRALGGVHALAEAKLGRWESVAVAQRERGGGPFVITLATASAYVGQLTAKQVATLATKLASNRLWSLKAAHEAFGEVPRPHPRWSLSRWLKRPETLTEVLLAPDQPGEDVARQVNEVLARNRRWRAMPSQEQLRRAEIVTVGVYSAVLSAHSPGWAARIGTARVLGAIESQSAVLRQLSSDVDGVGAKVSASAEAGNRERLETRLAQLPAATHESVLRAWAEDSVGTWRLVAAFTDPAVRPQSVGEEWEIHPPAWLGTAGPGLLLAGAELTLAYGPTSLARRLLLSAVREGAAGRLELIARAAMTYEPGQESEAVALLESAGVEEASPTPFVRAVLAVMRRDWQSAHEILAGWEPSGEQALVYRWSLAERVAFLSSAATSVTADMVAESIDRARRMLGHSWVNGVALTLGQRLIMRSVLGGADRPYADLKEARDLAIRVRDDRRRWRGDSAAAVALACEASLHASDWRAVIRMGTASGEASGDEAASPNVRRHVAIARAALGDIDDVPDLKGLPEAQELRIRALLAERTGQDPEPHWRAALAAAQEDADKVMALAGLARTGTTDLPGLDELSATHPDVAAQVAATGELARGESAAAADRLRGASRTSPQAAALLAEAYERLGRVDDAVSTLKEATQRFGDPDYAYLAVRVLHRHGRLAEASAAARGILASAPDAWPARTEVLQYVAQAAIDVGDPTEAEHLLRTSLDLDPSDVTARWGLVRLLLSRADPDAAYRVSTEHPTELSVTDGAKRKRGSWSIDERVSRRNSRAAPSD